MGEHIESVAGSLHLPSDDIYLLIGLVAGFVLGWIMGRQPSKDSAVIELEKPRLNSEPVHETPALQPADVSLVVNGKTVEVAPAIMEEIQAMIIGGNKLDAVKRLREASGLNHAAAKSVVGSLEKVIH